MKKYIFYQNDDLFGIFTKKEDATERLFIPKRMINISLQKGDIVEIVRMDNGYQISILK
ncbi:hypothetical protein [Psychrobacillus vulpis]|uniref:hypothetical protein n=1 Tax=Psychrobacillus vulpis TaxID=2325572 RepID=UPI00140A8F36|nr:hypothetical protein [Psychrobacillus vulpis]